ATIWATTSSRRWTRRWPRATARAARGTDPRGPPNPQTPLAHQTSKPLKIEIHDSLEAVGATAWDALQAGSRLRSPFLTWTWQREWVASFAPRRRLRVKRVTAGTG